MIMYESKKDWKCVNAECMNAECTKQTNAKTQCNNYQMTESTHISRRPCSPNLDRDMAFTSNICSWHFCAQQSLGFSAQSQVSLHKYRCQYIMYMDKGSNIWKCRFSLLCSLEIKAQSILFIDNKVLHAIHINQYWEYLFWSYCKSWLWAGRGDVVALCSQMNFFVDRYSYKT